MKILKRIALALGVLIAGILLFALTKPDTFRVQRSISINAAPEKIFALINDFHQWEAWSPWEKLDPAMKRTFSGPASGKGSVYAWEGNGQVGAGRMEILDTTQPTRILIDLQFFAPMEGHNTAEFLLQPQGGATTVSWSMQGPNTYLGKVIQVFCDIGDFVGKDFDKGLAGMKLAAEKN
ncbi:SRPBCC family protein [Viridibacterium curvum]|uniref:K(+)-transporting ATPase subunit F n=1 Tax=Viridibacterium curvum TaxID=1101404 RepID=A0ABP9QJY2_9RHOO